MYVGEEKQMGFILPGCKGQEEVWSFHEEVMVWLVLITIVVMWVLWRICQGNIDSKRRLTQGKLKHGDFLELVWTIIPGIILILIAYPSFKLLSTSNNLNPPTSKSSDWTIYESIWIFPPSICS